MSAVLRKIEEDRARLGAKGTPIVALAPPKTPAAAPVADNDNEGPPSAAAIAAEKKGSEAKRKAEAAAKLEAIKSTLRLEIDQHGTARLLIRRPNGRLDAPLAESTEATDYIRYTLKDATGKPPSRDGADSLISELRAKAREQCKTIVANTRIASDGDSVILDLARDDGGVVRINADGYTVEPQGDIVFLRGGGALPIPEQVNATQGAAIACAAFTDWGIPAADLPVMLVLIAEYLRPGTPKPILEIVGPAGARKSTLARNVASTIDPTPKGELPSTRLTEQDLMAACQIRYVFHEDNVSGHSGAEQDLLCRIVTGADILHRRLYEQHATAGAYLLNPFILTAITPVITRSDARSRTITLTLSEQRSGYKSALDVRKAFDLAHPGVLGAVCALLSAGLAGLDAVKAQRNYTHRLADFEMLGEAIHQALGQAPGWFGALLADRRRADAVNALQDDPLLVAIMREVAKLEGSAAVVAAPPSARSWARVTGETSFIAGGQLYVMVLVTQLLKTVGHAMWSNTYAAAPTERALKHAITHRQPTLSATGWRVEFRKIDDRACLVMVRKAAA